MNRRRLLALLGIACLTCLLAISWPLAKPLPAAQSDNQILVSAAISLKDALEEIKSTYQTSQPSVRITYNFGASGTLQRQIEQGAPADIFISAGKKQMDALAQQGLLLSESRRNLVSNRLVLVVPSNSTLGLTSFYNLADANVKRIAVGEPRSVPAGQYAAEVLNKLGLSAKVKSKLVLGNNVRQVLAAVESGNADAGIVYTTDARVTNRVKVVATAREQDHAPIVYPMAILKASKHSGAAQSFATFLSSSQAQGILRKYGFSAPK